MFPEMKHKLGQDFDNVTWMQDGTTCHRGKNIMSRMNDKFGDNMLALMHI